jgi:hypothetical protein
MNAIDKHLSKIMSMDTFAPIFRVLVSRRCNSAEFDAWVQFKCVYPSDEGISTEIYSGDTALIALLKLERAIEEHYLNRE